MSLLKNSKSPPEAMTWSRGVPVIVIAVVFDVLRIFFEMFWIFGPALAGIYCIAQTNDVAIVGGLLAKGCVAGTAALGYFGGPALMLFGNVMAIAIGLFGWLTIGLVLIITNARIFTEHASHKLWLVGSLLISEIPIIGSLPAFTVTIVKMYHAQIKKDKETLKKYAKGSANSQLQERRQQSAGLIQLQGAQMQQTEQRDAMKENMRDGEQVGNEESRNIPASAIRFTSERRQQTMAAKQNIPDKMRKVA